MGGRVQPRVHPRRRRRADRPDVLSALLARCVHGLEWVCAAEIALLPGVTGIRVAHREVAFALPAPVAPLRTADDVFLRVGTAAGATPSAVAAALGDLPWEQCVAALPRPVAPVLDVVAAVAGHRFSRFAVEHAVGDLLAARLGGTYLRRTADGREPGSPDLAVRVDVRSGVADAAVRLGVAPLHRRDWKRDTGPGTLHPPVAAALARLADPAPGAAVLDPFCGDGTVAIETALARPDVAVTGRDLDPARLANAARNAARAGVAVRWERADAAAPGPRADVVVTNPPWNLAVDGAGRLRDGLGPLWRRLPDVLGATGRLVLLADAALTAPAALAAAGFGLGPGARIRLAGRVSDVVPAAPGAAPALPADLAEWRERAVAAGVGF